MPTIHPTAIVDSGASLDEGVEIGAYSIVESDVVIGKDTWVGPHVVIKGHTSIGQRNKIYQFSSIGEAPQYSGYAGEPTRLEIGDDNTIREYCTLNRGTAGHLGTTSIGSRNFIMAYVHIAHDCRLGDNIIFANGASLAGHVDVGDYAIMGGFSLVHQFCKVGAHCITGIGAICFQDVPPYIVAAGNSAKPFGINVKGLRRRDFSEQTIAALKHSYKLLYRSNLDFQSAISQIAEQHGDSAEVRLFNDFLKQSDRGIIR
ncbi:MAG: acyl-ACP--UDP-N-acetylglucosamine O-acyltransferase [Pseudomonadota bacterium]